MMTTLRCGAPPLALLLTFSCADGEPAAPQHIEKTQKVVAPHAEDRIHGRLGKDAQRALSGFDVREGVASATLLGLMYDVRVSEAGEFEIGETPAVLPSGERAARWAYTLGKPIVRMAQATSAVELEDRAQLEVTGSRLTRRWGVVAETFDHEHGALKHSITVSERPAGAGRLVVSWPVLGGGQHQPEGDAQMLVRDAQGRARLVWSGLVVRDLDGNRLNARFERTGEALTISVDTTGARFPIVIDPLATNPATTLEGDQGAANFGTAIHAAGDVNGDGFDDLLVGQPNYTHGAGIKSGRALLFLGSAFGVANTASWSLVTDTKDDRVGDAVAGLGDVDGDGFADFAIGAPQAESSGSLNNEGAVWVYRGASAQGLGQLALPPVWTRFGGVAERRLGQRLAPAGDVNCDGKPDMIISALDPNTPATTGRVEVHSGQGGMPFFAPVFWSQDGESNGFGDSISTAGNINGTVNGTIKCDSIIIGDFSFDDGGPTSANRGKAYIYTGSPTGLSAMPAATRVGVMNGDRVGRSVSGGEDINGDGLDDVLISSQIANNSGRVDAYLGDAMTAIAATPTWSVTGTANTRFGLFVELLPDVTGDNRPDVAVAANGTNGNFGAVHLYFNSAMGLSAVPNWTYAGTAATDQMGTNVRGLGDVNNDGLNDFAISAAGATAQGRTTAGRVFVFHGGDGCTINGVSVGRGDQNPMNPCEVCDPTISQTAWSPAANGLLCDDGNACTTNTVCTAGVCGGGTVNTCDDGNSCTVGTCNPMTGTCSQAPANEGNACDDGLFCTVNTTCTAGVCGGGVARDCGLATQCGALPTCDEAADTCVAGVALPNGTACDDGDACTQVDSCQGGVCVGSNPVVCPPPGLCKAAGVCDPATGMCSAPDAPDGTMCDDGNACTFGTTCEAGVCQGGSPISCDDNNDCTANSCDPGTGCASVNVMDGTACADGDGLACTAGVCSAGGCVAQITIGCVINGACVADGAANPTNPCEVCDPTRSRVAYSPAAQGVACGAPAICDGMGRARPAEVCDGMGACVAPAPVSCGLFACDAGVCLTSCMDDADCAGAAFCMMGVCSTDNRAPVADAGDDVVARAETSVVFDGTRSVDPDGDVLTYQWEVVSSTGPSMVTLINPTVATPSLTLPRDPVGTVITVRLTVTDPDGLSDTDEATATIQDVDNTAPTAAIDGPATAFAGDMITLLGSMSSDPEGDALAFNWTVQTPAGADEPTLGATDTDALSVTFPATIAAPTVYTFTLVVRDSFGLNSQPATLAITVEPIPLMDDVDMGQDMAPDMGADMPVSDMEQDLGEPDMMARPDMAQVKEGKLQGSGLLCVQSAPAGETQGGLWFIAGLLGLVGWRRRVIR
jgi:hypothetical protein